MVGLRLLLLKRFDSTCCRALRGNLDCISIDVVNWATGLEYYGVFLFLHYIKKSTTHTSRNSVGEKQSYKECSVHYKPQLPWLD